MRAVAALGGWTTGMQWQFVNRRWCNCAQMRRRVVSASRMAAHAAGNQMGRMHAAAARALESPAARGYCKVCDHTSGLCSWGLQCSA